MDWESKKTSHSCLVLDFKGILYTYTPTKKHLGRKTNPWILRRWKKLISTCWKSKLPNWICWNNFATPGSNKEKKTWIPTKTGSKHYINRKWRSDDWRDRDVVLISDRQRIPGICVVWMIPQSLKQCNERPTKKNRHMLPHMSLQHMWSCLTNELGIFISMTVESISSKSMWRPQANAASCSQKT